jgi:hypothetical protein
MASPSLPHHDARKLIFVGGFSNPLARNNRDAVCGKSKTARMPALPSLFQQPPEVITNAEVAVVAAKPRPRKAAAGCHCETVTAETNDVAGTIVSALRPPCETPRIQRRAIAAGRHPYMQSAVASHLLPDLHSHAGASLAQYYSSAPDPAPGQHCRCRCLADELDRDVVTFVTLIYPVP